MSFQAFGWNPDHTGGVWPLFWVSLGFHPKMPHFEPAPRKGDIGNEAEDGEWESGSSVS